MVFPSMCLHSPFDACFRHAAGNFLAGVLEAGVLLMVCLSPWAFGSTRVEFESVLDMALAGLLGCWAVQLLLQRELSWRRNPLALILTGLILCGAWQLTPLPHQWLSWLSPGTVGMNNRLFPSEPEILPCGEAREAPLFSAGSTISFYPGRTMQELIRLVAVCALFHMVQISIASSASLRRFCFTALVNGALLSLFGLIQFFTAPPNTVYWTWPSAGAVFGPFICRNHFACYLNLCVGIGVGLLLEPRYAPVGQTESGRPQGLRDPVQESIGEASNILHEPLTLWTIASLALMISSVLVCVSRGGIVALLSGGAFCLGLNWRSYLRFRRLSTILLTLLVVLALVSWFGLARMETRLATLRPDEVRKEGRLSLWYRTLTLARNFPIWGTGYGTFAFVEPLCRSDPTDEGIYTNAENEYLEGLIEGGLVRLTFSLLAVGFVFRRGYRAVHRYGGRRNGGLAMGSMLGFTTLAAQSFVDFGLHIPAIALFVTVLCAHLCALGRSSGQPVDGIQHRTLRHTTEQGGSRLRLRGLAPIAWAAFATMFGLVLGYEGWRTLQAHEFRMAASSPSNVPVRAGFAHRAKNLTAAAELMPEHAELQVELALLYNDRYREQGWNLQRRDNLAEAAQVVAELAALRPALFGVHSGFAIAPRWLALSTVREQWTEVEEKGLTREYLVPALRYFLQARALCPLLSEPHRCLAASANQLQRADPRLAYWERTASLVPNDPALWYACGEESLDKYPDQALKYWQRSLTLSDRYLPLILERSIVRLKPGELCDQVLPRDPNLLLKAALQLHPESTAERQSFLDEALRLLSKQPGPLSANELCLKASILSALDRQEEALAVYEAALAQEPHQAGWRFKLAGLLFRQNRLREARRELLLVLSQQPDNQNARGLLAIVERKIAESL